MPDSLIFITNDDTQNNPWGGFQLVVEMFGHSTKWTNQLKSNKSPQSFKPTNKKILL